MLKVDLIKEVCYFFSGGGGGGGGLGWEEILN